MSHPTITPRLVEKALRQLKKDPVLAPVLRAYKPCSITAHDNYYRELVESIIGQQLSVKAAATINQRFVALFGGDFPWPQAILQKTIEELRTAGLSNAKAQYVRNVAQHIVDGKLDFAAFNTMSNDEVVAQLTAIKGVGQWTAHMFLIFCMARSDVLPTGDLGVRSGIMKLYKLEQLPSPAEMQAIAQQRGWHPYESIASWYMWVSLDNPPQR